MPVPRKGDRFNPSIYRPVALLSSLSKAFETILNRKVLKHLSDSNLFSDRQYGFCKQRFTFHLFVFLTNSWSLFLNSFDENFAAALDMSKAFDRVCLSSFLPKLLSGFPPSLSTFTSSFQFRFRLIYFCHRRRSLFPKHINNDVLKGFVLSPTLFLLFINDLSITNCPLYSSADDSTLHYSTSFNKRPT